MTSAIWRIFAELKNPNYLSNLLINRQLKIDLASMEVKVVLAMFLN